MVLIKIWWWSGLLTVWSWNYWNYQQFETVRINCTTVKLAYAILHIIRCDHWYTMVHLHVAPVNCAPELIMQAIGTCVSLAFTVCTTTDADWTSHCVRLSAMNRRFKLFLLIPHLVTSALMVLQCLSLFRLYLINVCTELWLKNYKNRQDTILFVDHHNWMIIAASIKWQWDTFIPQNLFVVIGIVIMNVMCFNALFLRTAPTMCRERGLLVFFLKHCVDYQN